MDTTQLERLISIIAKLRDPIDGCPWDREQTHKSLTRFIIEEAYEFVQAVEDDKIDDIEEELGDVLLQVVLHAQIGKENKNFDLESISKRISDKLEYRHPHVFGKMQRQNISSEQVKTNWQKLKTKEKKQKFQIDENFLALPSLMSAHKIGKKTSHLNFDWDNATQVMNKVEEEWEEFKAEMNDNNLPEQKVKEELGDLLFSMAQLSRHLGWEAEEVLREANKKFIKRFQHMETAIENDEELLGDVGAKQMEKYWHKAKKALKVK